MEAQSALTIDQFLTYLAPEVWRIDDATGTIPAPVWPADMFGICAALLEKSGAYSKIGIDFQPTTISTGPYNPRTNYVLKVAREWRTDWTDNTVPDVVVAHWQILCAEKQTPVTRIQHHRALCQAICELVSICDETCSGMGAGLGSYQNNESSEPQTNMLLWGEILLSPVLDTIAETLKAFWPVKVEFPFLEDRVEYGSSLCAYLHPTRIRVLPKCQTPRRGLSLRSITHHLTFCPPVGIQANWHAYGFESEWRSETDSPPPNENCNIMIVPWPFSISPLQFQATRILGHKTGWFNYYPPEARRDEFSKDLLVVTAIRELIEDAERNYGPVHVLVLPELAVSNIQFHQLYELAKEKKITLIGGVCKPYSQSDSDPNQTRTDWTQNMAYTSFQSSDGQRVLLRQSKHHRWVLDEPQIIRYGLASQLHPERQWWENIAVHPREINFLKMREWMTVAVMLCEDLARIDPVGRLVRAVGPDLVITLLMDGPQIEGRWPTYHATVLADDPGCSVLTLTSLGMIDLSRPPEHYGKEPQRAIAMWRDPDQAPITITLPEDKKAAILTVVKNRRPEVETADGRQHTAEFGSPKFGGVYFL